MRKRLSAIGNSLGLVVEKPILELLDIDRETELEMTTDGHRLIIEPVRERQKKILAASKRVLEAHELDVPQAGEVSDPFFLTVDDILLLHERELARYGGASGLRDSGALESAVAMPASTFGREFHHPDVFAMAAAYAFPVAQNQPFVDGNKRAGLEALLKELASK